MIECLYRKFSQKVVIMDPASVTEEEIHKKIEKMINDPIFYS